jgi:MarR family transcriptional regulator, organic hydroperoxide resistance regulator
MTQRRQPRRHDRAGAPANPTRESKSADGAHDLTLEMSIGAQVKRTQRSLSRSLQLSLLPHEIPIGMWYFLRVLWENDGLSQREISHRVGATAATATQQLRNMEERGLVTRSSGKFDRRKVHFMLTPKAWALQNRLLKIPLQVEAVAMQGFTAGEVGFFRLALIRIQDNLARHHAEHDARGIAPLATDEFESD